jgi:gliding motility-associated-like protein
VNGGTGPYTYSWNNGATAQNVNNLFPGSYTVTITDANGCVYTQTSTIADSTTLAIHSIEGSDICMGNTATITTDPIVGATLQWQYNGAPLTGANTNTFVTPVGGTYQLVATSVCGTYTSNPVSIVVRSLNNVSISNNVIICPGESVQLQAGGGVTYNWTPETGLTDATIANPVASPTESTTYTVNIKDNYGCTATANVFVAVMCDTLNIPNGFSPNGDGTNDFFVIKGLDNYPGTTIFIYNRWGNLVYKKQDYHNDWNGQSNVNGVVMGQDLPNGTYYYILDLKTDTKPLNGFVVIRR